ncbi:RnfABCDGE type electron transport complex subunit D, partial [Escherichia coli]|nr:RnfABCDGE type electron transport complex subunit D [Escherichia coli]
PPFFPNPGPRRGVFVLGVVGGGPGFAGQVWFFGWGTLVQFLLASVSALLAEALVLKLRKQSVAATLKDNSALLTGLLLAVSIPPPPPCGRGVLGTGFGGNLPKTCVWGLGETPFYQHLGGYVFFLVPLPGAFSLV